MKKIKGIALFAIISAFTLAGCAGSRFGSRKKEKVFILFNYI